jgi:NTP pyrophosphatase (non-canonical NTP hydrolase)
MRTAIQETINDIRAWGQDKGITGDNAKGTPAGQLCKLEEEVLELQTAWVDNNKAEMIDAIGDITVVLILLSELLGLHYEQCVQSAYDVISKRKGVMVDGQFVKHGDK